MAYEFKINNDHNIIIIYNIIYGSHVIVVNKQFVMEFKYNNVSIL